MWHAVAYGVSAGAPPTVSFVRPAACYVCLGYHRGLDEVDHEYCQKNELPVLRRMVGGGPVYLDENQLFFQICLPVASVPAARLEALRMLLEPAASAFGSMGVPARVDDTLEICVGDRKICGHGAGQIAEAVVLCGNLIEHFDHDRATRVLAIADSRQRELTLELMRRFVGATPIDPETFKSAVVVAYGAALGLDPVAGELTGVEQEALVELDARFTTQAWLAGPGQHRAQGSQGERARKVKVRSGVWTLGASFEGAQVVASVVNGSVEQAWLSAGGPGRPAYEAELALRGVRLTSVADVLSAYGEPGRLLAGAFENLDPRGL